MTSFTTPVLLIAWRRPNHLRQVIDAVRKVAPTKMFVAVDGARLGDEYANERRLIEETKEVIAKEINWECDVKTLFREENLGCAKGVSSAISWFFEHNEEGIILEDDCVPNTSFFNFCSTLLDRYRSNIKIMHIGGINYQNGDKYGIGGYYYSKYSHIWGWATWRRAWLNYRLHIKANEEYIANVTQKYCEYHNEINFWNNRFKEQIHLEGDTWDFQWQFAIWSKGGLAIYPNHNLIINIGLNNEINSTHLTKTSYIIAHDNKVSTNSLLRKPMFQIRNIWGDNMNFHRAFGTSVNISIKKKLYVMLVIIRHKFNIMFK